LIFSTNVLLLSGEPVPTLRREGDREYSGDVVNAFNNTEKQ